MFFVFFNRLYCKIFSKIREKNNANISNELDFSEVRGCMNANGSLAQYT